MKTSFAQRLRNAISQSGMTYAELSEKTGISPSSISDWVNGRYKAKQDKIFILANALQVPPSYLLGITREYILYPEMIEDITEIGRDVDLKIIERDPDEGYVISFNGNEYPESLIDDLWETTQDIKDDSSEDKHQSLLYFFKSHKEAGRKFNITPVKTVKNEDKGLRRIARARENMSQQEKEKMEKILEAAFSDFFEDE